VCCDVVEFEYKTLILSILVTTMILLSLHAALARMVIYNLKEHMKTMPKEAKHI
jgi:hypothetical protein